MPSWSARDLAKLDALKARLAASESERAAQAERIAILSAAARDDRDASRTRARELAHRVPSEEALKHVLPLRAAALRSAACEAPVWREPPSPTAPPEWPADRVEIGGLTFFVPQDAGVPGKLSARILGGWLPLREIAATRDVAVGAVMIDIGANVGTTVVPRVALGDFGWAYALEADPANAESLRRAVEVNGFGRRISVDHMALADHDGTIRLARSTQIGTHHIVLGAETTSGTIEVPCRRLDTWVREREVNVFLVTFIKCDVEGAELAVLLGAPEVLAHKHIAWQVEFSPATLISQHTAPVDLLALATDRFDYFIDLQGDGSRARCRPTAELKEAVAYVGTAERAAYTNLVLFNGPPRPD